MKGSKKMSIDTDNTVIDLAQEVLNHFYQNRKEKCTCRPLYNTSKKELDFGMSATQGCILHCTHYGISSGGRCYCGEEDVN